VAHVVCTSKTRLASLGELRERAAQAVAPAEDNRADRDEDSNDGAIGRWTFTLTEVYDEEGSISYADAVRLATENASFDSYRVVRAEGLPPSVALAFLAGASLAVLAAGDRLVLIDGDAPSVVALEREYMGSAENEGWRRLIAVG
jgi:hypothetical protein